MKSNYIELVVFEMLCFPISLIFIFDAELLFHVFQPLIEGDNLVSSNRNFKLVYFFLKIL